MLGPPCFVACHSPDVAACNLCHVLGGSEGVVHLPLHLGFTGGHSLSRSDAGFGVAEEGQQREGNWRMEETETRNDMECFLPSSGFFIFIFSPRHLLRADSIHEDDAG